MESKLRASIEKNKLFEEMLLSKEEDVYREFFKRGMEKLLQESLEQEVTDYLGRDWYQRSREEKPKGYRNGYYDREVKTSEGVLNLRNPRVRNTEEKFRSEILSRIDDLEENLKILSREMYIRGLSTRDIEQTFVNEEGKTFLSKSSVSKLNESMSNEYEEFCSRDLSGLDVVYLFVDGVYEAVRKYTSNQALLCAWGICSDGTKQMIHLTAVESESERAWSMFFEEMISRGLRQPLLVVSDGNKGVKPAIIKNFPKSDRQRCVAHKLRNIISKIPKESQLEFITGVKSVYYATDHETAKVLAADFVDKYIDKFPSAVKCFNEDLEASIVNLKYPMEHRKFIRTTNLLERAFEEEKRRTKVFPQHQSEKALTGLVFSVLWRASLNWRKIPMRESELKILKNIRKLIVPGLKEETFISYKLAA